MAAAARPLGEAGNGCRWDGWMMLDLLLLLLPGHRRLGGSLGFKRLRVARFYDAIMIDPSESYRFFLFF